MKNPSPLATRAIIAASILAAALAAPIVHAVEVCSTPVPYADEYAPGDTNTVYWSAGASGGFIVQASTDATFATIAAAAEPGPSVQEREFTGLAETRYYYRVRAKAKTGTSACTQSPWSAVVSTIQDETPPAVTITTQPEPISPTPVRPPFPTYVMRNEIAITGTAHDLPGGSAPSGVGAHSVALALVNTTPVLGASSEVPVDLVLVNESDGTWLMRYMGAKKPATGTYQLQAFGIDAFGNTADEPTTLAILVVL